jgi:hypothetical protein
MPVSAWIAGGIGTSGSTSELHSLTQGDSVQASSTRTIPDLGAAVGGRARAGGFEIDEGEGGGHEPTGRLDRPNVRSLF